MTTDSFPEEVAKALRHYVYRLVDPRNGETFYVGRGQENRVFEHVRVAAAGTDRDAVDPKLERIRQIRAVGMDVAHVIHRHGMSESVASEVEAALIDAYPGLANKVAGSGSGDRGTQPVSEIRLEHTAEEFVVEEPLILISIGKLWRDRGVYGAVRGVWRLRMARAKRYKLVLAHVRGLVRGAYRPETWLKATAEDFPLDGGRLPDRIGFEGKEAKDVWEGYVGKRVPAKYRKPGAQTPCRYLDPE